MGDNLPDKAYRYPRRPDAELRKLAEDIADGAAICVYGWEKIDEAFPLFVETLDDQRSAAEPTVRQQMIEQDVVAFAAQESWRVPTIPGAEPTVFNKATPLDRTDYYRLLVFSKKIAREMQPKRPTLRRMLKEVAVDLPRTLAKRLLNR